MRLIVGTAIALTLIGTPAFADPPPKSQDNMHKGQIELAGSTDLSFNRITASDSGTSSSTNLLMISGGVVFYASERLGVGGVVNNIKISSTGTSTTFTTFGGVVKYRVPLSPKAAFYVDGTVGRFSVGSSGSTPTHSTFFGGGAGADVFLADNVAITLGLTFQHAKIDTTSLSGLVGGFGFILLLK